MKAKVTIALAALVAALVLAACGGGDDSGGSSTSSGPRHVRVAILLPSLGQGASQQIKQGVDAQTPKEQNADVVFRAGTSDQDLDTYIANIDDAITQHFDAIGVVPQDPKRMGPVLKRAVAAGVKVVLLEADDPTFPDRAAAVYTDNKPAAKLDGEYLARVLPNGGKLGILSCFPGQYATIDDRVDGMKEGLAANPKIRVVTLLDARCDRERGRSAMEDMLTAHPDLNAVFSVSDTQTLGALIALDAAGRRDVIVSSIDAQDEMVQRLKDGLVGSTVSYNFVRGGELGVQTVVKVARGESVPDHVDTGATLITNENAASQG